MSTPKVAKMKKKHSFGIIEPGGVDQIQVFSFIFWVWSIHRRTSKMPLKIM